MADDCNKVEMYEKWTDFSVDPLDKFWRLLRQAYAELWIRPFKVAYWETFFEDIPLVIFRFFASIGRYFEFPRF